MSASVTLHLLAGPLAFLFFAAPLAALLDDLGLFKALAARVGSGRHVAIEFWLLSVATVALVNLDAAVVLLTPLAVRVATHTARPALPFAAIPSVAALLASSALPVSNLTNLVLVSRDDLHTVDLLAHLGLPTLVAVTVGWFLLRDQLQPGEHEPTEVALLTPEASNRALRVGALVLVPTTVAFIVLPGLGLELWPAALAADLALLAVLRRVPWRSLPVALVTGVAVVAVVVGRLSSWVGLDDVDLGHGAGVTAVVALLAAGAANLVNNLPALLGALPAVPSTGAARWGLLLGANAGAGLLLTGSLSTLLWRSILRQRGVDVSARWFLRFGLRVTLPSFIAALAVLVTQEALFF